MLPEFDEVLDKLNQGPSTTRLPLVDTTDTSGRDTDTSQPRQRVHSKHTFEKKKSYATDELAGFFVTGLDDAMTKLSELYCKICRKDVSVLTHGSSESLRHFQGIRHFAREQRLRFEIPGSRVLDFDSKPLTEDDLERLLDKILRAISIVRDREYSFRKDLIPGTSRNADLQLPLLAKVFLISGAFCLDGQPSKCHCCLVG